MSAQAVKLPKVLFSSGDESRMWQWVDSVYNTLSQAEKVSQLIMPMYYPDHAGARREQLIRDTEREGWGGVLFQKGFLEDQRTITLELQHKAKIPLLISLDGEWGLYMRLKDAPRYPRNMGLGYSGDLDLVYRYGQEVARQCRLMGIHINFAPTLDVNINPKNPVIGTRSFGAMPREVSRMGLAYARGLEEHGVASVAKHFPGHGDTSEDSHKTLPVVSASRDRLEQVELYPFREYIANGLSGVMVGHLRIPALDKTGMAASLSNTIVTQLLQQSMGFKGLIFTDALAMEGALKGGVKDVGVAALKAGNDILLAPLDPIRMKQEILAALQAGRLSPELLEGKVRKVLAYKYKLIISQPRRGLPIEAGDIKEAIWTRDSKVLLAELWKASIYQQRTNPAVSKLLSLHRGRDMVILSSQALGSEANLLYQSLLPGAEKIVWSAKKRQAILAKTRKAKLRVVQLQKAEAISLADLRAIAAQGPTLIVWYASPFKYPKQAFSEKFQLAVWWAFEPTREAEQAVAEKITSGERETPVKKKAAPLEPRSSRSSLIEQAVAPLSYGFDSLRLLAQWGVQEGVYPGCQIVVNSKGKQLFDEAFGYKMDQKNGDRVDRETIYDLASLTKAIATTPALMLLCAEKKLKLAAPLEKYMPELKGLELGRVTIRELLLHQSGLPAGYNFYELLIDSTSYTAPLVTGSRQRGYVSVYRNAWANPNFSYDPRYISTKKDKNHSLPFSRALWISPDFRRVILEKIAELPLRKRGRYRYGDLNFVLLQEVVERLSGTSLDRFVTERIYKPLGAKLYFRPLEASIALEQIAPAQRDFFLRKELIQGTVDDETAAMLGGVSGNAGLFGSAREVAKVGQMLLDGGKSPSGVQIIPREVVRTFTNTTGYKALRFLGFDKPSKERRDVAAAKASLNSYGHYGFTGSCFWVDPDRKVVFVFLSNRTYPDRNNMKISQENIRPRLHQLVYQALGY